MIFKNINTEKQNSCITWRKSGVAALTWSQCSATVKPADALKTASHWSQLSYSPGCFYNGSVQTESLRRGVNVSPLSLQIRPQTEGAQSGAARSVHSLFLRWSTAVARVFLTERVCVCGVLAVEAVTSSQSWRQVTNRVCSLPTPIHTEQEKLSYYPPRLKKRGTAQKGLAWGGKGLWEK